MFLFLFLLLFSTNIKFTQPFREVSEEISTAVGMAPFRLPCQQFRWKCHKYNRLRDVHRLSFRDMLRLYFSRLLKFIPIFPFVRSFRMKVIVLFGSEEGKKMVVSCLFISFWIGCGSFQGNQPKFVRFVHYTVNNLLDSWYFGNINTKPCCSLVRTNANRIANSTVESVYIHRLAHVVYTL